MFSQSFGGASHMATKATTAAKASAAKTGSPAKAAAGRAVQAARAAQAARATGTTRTKAGASRPSDYTATVVGAGPNRLVAPPYLARSGTRTLPLQGRQSTRRAPP